MNNEKSNEKFPLVSKQRLGEIIEEFMHTKQNWFDTQLLFGGLIAGKFLVSGSNFFMTSDGKNYIFAFTSEARLDKCEPSFKNGIFKERKWVDFQNLMGYFNNEEIDAFLFDYKTSNFPLSKESYKRIFVPRYNILQAQSENKTLLGEEYPPTELISSTDASRLRFLVPSGITKDNDGKSKFLFYTIKNAMKETGIPVFTDLQNLRQWSENSNVGGKEWLDSNGVVVPFTIEQLSAEIQENHYSINFLVIDMLNRKENIIKLGRN